MPQLRTAIAAALSLLVLAPAVADAKPTQLKVMTRNLYLGADLSPGFAATNLQELVNGAGVIYNEVLANDYNTRAKGLAAEIQAQKPDLVGLQEGALWRTNPCDKNPLPPNATTVLYDSVDSLLKELNKGKAKYRLVVKKPEFDFEVWANTDGNEQTSGPNCPMGSEINGRLTMHDAIIARVGTVKTSKPKSGTFKTLLQARPAGVNIDVTRGWTSTEATKGGKKFKFVNAHFEAFDSLEAGNHTSKGDVNRGEIRQAQAREMVARGGPATGRVPVIFVGDFNSDTVTEVQKGDSLGFRVLLKAGFVRVASRKVNTCCLNDSLLKTSGKGKRSDFDHTVDHVMTNKPKKVKFVRSVVTGLTPVNGFWDSDHAGLFSVLSLP